MKSALKRSTIKAFRWFVNATGLIDNPNKASTRLLFALFGVFAVTTGIPYFVKLGPLVSASLSLIGIGAILCMLGVMTLGMALEADRQGNSKLRNYFDESQTRLDAFENK